MPQTSTPVTVGLESSDLTIRTELVRTLSRRQGSVVHEFSLPTERLRADVVQVGRPRIAAYEIKSAVDRLDRLDRQVCAYQDVFSLCHAVVARLHVSAALDTLPPWWGVMTARKDGAALRTIRRARFHALIRPEVLVKVLWRAEAEALALQLGLTAPERASRHALWELLIRRLSALQMERFVSRTLLARDPQSARIPARWAGNR